MSDEKALSSEHRFLHCVASAFRSGDFDATVDLAARSWGGLQGSPGDRAAFCLWLGGELQVVTGLSSADGFEVAFALAHRLGVLRTFARVLADIGKAMKPHLDAGATVDEASAAVLQAQPVTRH